MRDNEGSSYYRDHNEPFLHLLFQRPTYWKRLVLGFLSLVLVIALPFFVFIVLPKNGEDKIGAYFPVFPAYFTSDSSVCMANEPEESLEFEKSITAKASAVLYFYEIESKRYRWKMESLNPNSFLVSSDCAKMEVRVKRLGDTNRIKLLFKLSQLK